MTNYTTTASGIHVPTDVNDGTDFELGLKQMGDDIDLGLILATGRTQLAVGGTALTTAFADIAGTTISVTPPAAAQILIVTRFEVSFSPAGGAAQFLGLMGVDGTDDDVSVLPPASIATEPSDSTLEASVLRRYSLTVAAHTIKARAKWIDGSGTGVAPFLTACEVIYALVRR